ncbi:MAG TPA: homocysteine S-methyltransferase family protein [Thermoanaerobaculia bacterium]|nr:homocysteine S-methyltransferase family protein [Thermoanaerobaculia bacterium]
MASFRERLRSGPPVLLDSAMGTELQRRGANTRLPLWSAWALVEVPELVSAIHRDEVSGGAEVLTANTFRTHRRTLEKGGLGARAGELTALAVRLAREAAGEVGREVLVAGSLSPLEDCYRPDLVPEDDALSREHHEQAERLAAAGVDLILLETHNTVRELAAAARAARASGLPIVASMVTNGSGRLLSGEPIEDAVRAVEPLGPAALSINCVPARRLGFDLSRLAATAPEFPLGAYGNLGMPEDESGWTFSGELAPDAYADCARRWIAAGARIIGGCCGTTSAHTTALRKLLDSLLP